MYMRVLSCRKLNDEIWLGSKRGAGAGNMILCPSALRIYDQSVPASWRHKSDPGEK